MINQSAPFVGSSIANANRFEEASGSAERRGVIVVAAAGKHSRVGSTALAEHPWVMCPSLTPYSDHNFRGHPYGVMAFGDSDRRFSAMRCGSPVAQRVGRVRLLSG